MQNFTVVCVLVFAQYQDKDDKIITKTQTGEIGSQS